MFSNEGTAARSAAASEKYPGLPEQAHLSGIQFQRRMGLGPTKRQVSFLECDVSPIRITKRG